MNKLEQRMQHKSYRFIWFARQSWAFMQGDRRSFFRNFWPAWREFNVLALHDINGCPNGCCKK
jgi:hypothetical protein